MAAWCMGLAALRARVRPFDVLTALQALVLSAMLAACGGGGGTSPAPQIAITAQPADAHVTSGQTATFTVGVSGAASYRWQSSTGGAWADIQGATGATYAFTAGMPESGAQFRVIVASTANAANTLTSSAATLTVDAAATPVRIVLEPQSPGATYDGEERTLYVTADGTSPAYQWQRSGDHGLTWSDIAGATEPSFTLPMTVADDGALLRVVVGNALGQQSSDAVTLEVHPAPALPLFRAVPFNATVPIGQPATFNALAIGDPAPTLKWQTAFESSGPWTDIAGATDGTYTLAATSAADDGRLVRAVATNANGSNFAVASLSVTATSLAPGFSEQPGDLTVATGSAATLAAHGYGAPSVSYQWQVSTDGGTTFVNINGATDRLYTITHTAGADDGKRMRVVVTNSLGSATSRAAQLSVMDAPALDWIGSGERWRPGVTGAYFLARATGGQLHYQWQTGVSATGTSADAAGATARDFVLPASTPAGIDQVCVTVSNPVGSLKRCAPVAAITWRDLNKTPMTGSINAVARTGATTALAAGTNGTMLRSTDGGVTWTVTSEASWSLKPVTTIAMRGQNGIATAGYDTRFTADGGQHWYTGPQDFFPAEGAAYAPDGTLVKVGDTGVRLSADDGMTWRDATVDAGFSSLWRVAFNTAGVGIAVGVGQGVTSSGNTGAIARSADGGATWTTMLTTGSPVGSVAFASDGVAVAVDWQGNAWRSADAGLTWTARPTGASTGLYTVAFASANVGVAYGFDAGVVRTVDGGLNWAVVGPVMNMYGITSLDANTFLAGGDSGTPLRSTDGGLTWTAEGTGDGPALVGAAFTSGSVGIVVGSNGTIERSTDGGVSWNSVASGVTSELMEVRFGDATHGLAVGDAGVVLRTSDAGASWQRAASPTVQAWSLSSLTYATPTVAYAADYTGVWKTTDAGATWQSAGNFGSQPGTFCVRFGDALHGLVAAQNRQLWRTTDGGQTWSVVTTDFDQAGNQFDGLQDMAFLTPTTVLGVTGTGLAVRSTDAGATWQATSSGLSYTSHVYFRDTQVGIAVGDGIARTTDGGLTWTRDPGALTQPWMGGATAVGPHSMIVVGGSNLIYRNDGF
jgi:photosystem II stability/assembly factor-like uncharacterized protein